MPDIVLASASPRRCELLKLLFSEFRTVHPQVDEKLPEETAPADAVELLALRKARAAAQTFPRSLVIGADTLVALEEKALGKPADASQARDMLSRLSGRVHEVYTGVALCTEGGERVFHETTRVRFAKLSPEEIAWYVSTGEGMDKAGAYGIQGLASRFITGIQGDYFNVVGLPLHGIYENLGGFSRILLENS